MEADERIPNTPTWPMDLLWAKEVEDRLAAYQRGEIKALLLNDVLGKYMAHIGPSVSTQFPTSLKPPTMR